MNSTYEDLFRKDMDSFLQEYRDKLATNLREGLSINTWKDVRDTLLFDFPRLRECYAAHGREQDIPRDDQTEKAKLGRMLAGAMAAFRKDMYEVNPKEKPCEMSQAVVSAVSAGGGSVAMPRMRGPINCADVKRNADRGWRRITDAERNKAVNEFECARNWIKQSPITKVVTKPKKDMSNDPLALELTGLKMGEQISFYYHNQTFAREDQHKVAWIAQQLGWYKTVPDGRRPYSTKTELEQDTLLWVLTIQRLDTSSPLPITRKKS